ncbi:MAG: hypothetical protein OEY94_06260 [Alphaproteobacteria bacterium]|nr:hypothetical protein [Alphaproteobacteria bacterium]
MKNINKVPENEDATLSGQETPSFFSPDGGGISSTIREIFRFVSNAFRNIADEGRNIGREMNGGVLPADLKWAKKHGGEDAMPATVFNDYGEEIARSTYTVDPPTHDNVGN